MAAPTVTALRERTDGRVGVELDGEAWRVLPADAVVRAELRRGGQLDRERARRLARELRRVNALKVAARTLRYRDISTRRLAERLDQRGVGGEARDEALEALTRSGVVDDERFAGSRARALAERSMGDAAIRHDLEQQGLAPDVIAEACAALPSERARAGKVMEKRGRSAATARYLARRGFGEDAVELAAPDVCAPEEPAELG